MGGTFSTSMTIDYFPAEGRPCYLCSECITSAPEVWEQVKPDIITELKDISFLPKNNNPIGRSSVVVCTTCGELMTSHFLNWLFLAEEKPYKASRLIFYHNTFEIVKFDIEMFKKCPFCSTEEDWIEYEKEQEKKKEEEQKKKEEEEKKRKEEE
jgi:predicted molibdopterin-dependent oxidoreductase YjgC